MVKYIASSAHINHSSYTLTLVRFIVIASSMRGEEEVVRGEIPRFELGCVVEYMDSKCSVFIV